MSIPESPEYSRAKVAVNAFLQGENLMPPLADTVVIPWPIAEDRLALYLNASRESFLAYEACIKFSERFTQNSLPIPRELASWAIGVLNGRITRPKKSGRKKYTNINRNYIIREAVRIAVENGLTPTRNDAFDASEHPSSCDLVSDLVSEILKDLGMKKLKYSGVAKVWESRSKRNTKH